MAGLLSDAMNFFTGGGQYADPNAIDPRYGVPMSDVRQAGWNTIGNMGALLLAAGQPMEGSQRAQILAQLGQAGGRFNTDIYNAAQSRLMMAQMQEKRAEMDELNVIRDLQKNDPEKLARSLGEGFTADRIRGLPAGDIRAIARQKLVAEATRDPLEREIKEMNLQALRDTRARELAAAEYLRTRNQAPQAGAVPPAAPGAPGVAPAAPSASGASLPAGRSAEGFRLPQSVVETLTIAGKKPGEILATEAELALKQDRWVTVPPGDNPLRRDGGFSASQPLKVKLDASGSVIDYQTLGEDPEKAPANFRYVTTPQGERRLEPIPGGPGEQIASEVAARVGLGQAFRPLANEINKALDEGKFDLSNVKSRAQLATNTGEMASYVRRMEIGKEALLRGLTGAGMAISEASDYASRFSIGLADSPATVRDKLNLLLWSLDNVQNIVTRGRGDLPPPASGPAPFRQEEEKKPAPKARVLRVLE